MQWFVRLGDVGCCVFEISLCLHSHLIYTALSEICLGFMVFFSLPISGCKSHNPQSRTLLDVT